MRRASGQPLLRLAVVLLAAPLAAVVAGCGGGASPAGAPAAEGAGAVTASEPSPGVPRPDEPSGPAGQGRLADGYAYEDRPATTLAAGEDLALPFRPPAGALGALAEAGVVMPEGGATTLTCDLGAEGSVALRLTAEGGWSLVQSTGAQERTDEELAAGVLEPGRRAEPGGAHRPAAAVLGLPGGPGRGGVPARGRGDVRRGGHRRRPARGADLDGRLHRHGRRPARDGAPHAGPGLSVAPAPLAALDRRLAAPRPAVVRVLAWAAVDLVLLVLASVAGFLLLAVPPLSLLPSEEPLSLPDHVLLAVVFGSIGWALHLLVVAAVSRTRRARLWVVLASPLLGTATLLLPYLLAAVDRTARAVVLSWTLYGLVCRLLPPAAGPGRGAPAGPG